MQSRGLDDAPQTRRSLGCGVCLDSDEAVLVLDGTAGGLVDLLEGGLLRAHAAVVRLNLQGGRVTCHAQANEAGLNKTSSMLLHLYLHFVLYKIIKLVHLLSRNKRN